VAESLNQSPPDPYVHGHQESVLRTHARRTVDNSAAYLRPHLRADQTLLDVGCGPGTITIELAAIVSPGEVIGIDAGQSVIGEANALLAKPDSPQNCRFQRGDVYALDFDDDSFAVVHAHQVLQHLTDPVRALREMRRVLEPGGVLAVRDADYGAMTWTPREPGLDRWMELHHTIADHHGTQPDAGRHLLGWVRAAGFTDIEPGSSTWTFATPETRAWWATQWADRVRESSFASHALELGLSDTEELRHIAESWHTWLEQPDGWFMVPHGEAIARL